MSVHILYGLDARIARLTDEQVAALRAYQAEHGRYWKSKLLLSWERDDSHGEHTPLLRQVRILIGPSGLMRLNLKKLKEPT